MKVMASVKKICRNCRIIRRRGAVRVALFESAPQAEAGLKEV